MPKSKKAKKTDTDFIYFLSHELKKPLTVVKGYAALLLDGSVGKLDRQTRQIIKKIFFQDEEALNFIDDLLLVSRLEENRLKIILKATDFKSFWGELLPAIREGAQEAKHKFLASQPGSTSVLIDQRLTMEVLKRLLKKIFEQSLASSLEFKETPRFLVLSLSFQSRGITTLNKNKFFKKPDRKSLASGQDFCAYVAKSIIEKQGGRIDLKAAKRKGLLEIYLKNV